MWLTNMLYVGMVAILAMIANGAGTDFVVVRDSKVSDIKLEELYSLQ